MKGLITFLAAMALITGTLSCAPPIVDEPVEYSLTILSTEGGEVTTPGEGAFPYVRGTRVSLMAAPASGYSFAGWTGDVGTIANVRAASTTITMSGDYSVTANFQVIPVARYSLTIASTEGGSVTAPGEGTYTYDAGTVAELVAEAEEGYQFTYWTGSVGAVDDVNAASTTVTVMGDYAITANFAKEIRTWHDLHAIRDNLSGHYALVNDLDASTAGYAELAGPAANDRKGWEPIGSLSSEPFVWVIVDPIDPFAGSLDGRGYQIRGLSISRSDQDGIGLFGLVGEQGVVRNVGVVGAEIAGGFHVGVLVGYSEGTLIDSYSSGTLTGNQGVGGLVGRNIGTLHGSHSSVSVSGTRDVGGLVGLNHATIRNSHAVGAVTGSSGVGGLVGVTHEGSVSDSYSGGSVTGTRDVGGLVGFCYWGATVSNSYYNYDEVRINGHNVITIGALFGGDFEEWLANDKTLDVSARLSRVDGYYLINDVADFRQLLAFGQDGSLRFRLKDDLDLGSEPHLFVPYLAGEFDGNGHRISNLSFGFGFVSNVGLFGYLGWGGEVARLGVENADIIGAGSVGSLVGWSDGTVSTCYSSGGMIRGTTTGGLVGAIYRGTISNSYFTSGSVNGGWGVGGLVGWNYYGTVNNSHYDYDAVLVNGHNLVTIGALFSGDFQEWLGNDRFLDVDARLTLENGHYVIDNVEDFRQLLAFGQDDSLKFKLRGDLDLTDTPNFYVPYLGGQFDGNGHAISNLSVDFDFVSNVAPFGYLGQGAEITRVRIENADITGAGSVGGLVGYANFQSAINDCYAASRTTGYSWTGGLVGWNNGTVNRSHSAENVIGSSFVGGLVGYNTAVVSNSYSAGGVSGGERVGGLVGMNAWWGTVSNSYSTGAVRGDVHIGGLAGLNEGTVKNSFWDVETSGVAESAGGASKTTAQMKDIATFRTAGWSIVPVAPGQTDAGRVWNIVDGQTYPLLSWQPVS